MIYALRLLCCCTKSSSSKGLTEGQPPESTTQLTDAERGAPASELVAAKITKGTAKQEAPKEEAAKEEAAKEEAAKEEAAKKEEPATELLTRYIEPMSIWRALETKHVRLVKMSYLVAQHKAKRILARRQELPEEAFISVDELKRMYGDGNRDGVLPIIAISFCWLTPPHPDPEGKQLAIVAEALEREKAKYEQAKDSFKGFSEMGVFWDWLSIYQKDPKLFDWKQIPNAFSEGPERVAFEQALKNKTKFYGGEAYETSRSPEEKEAFTYALHETMDLWYAHQGTTVYMLTKLPEGAERKIGYNDSGWTTYERCSAEQIKKFYLFHAKWKLVLDLGAGKDATHQRRWPIGPDDFDIMIKKCKFTNGADEGAVTALYRKMSINQLGGIKMLDFDGMPAMAVEDGHRLGGCLKLCANLEQLDLRNSSVDNDACKAIFSQLGNGAIPQLQGLNLSDNQIGDDGMAAFAAAIASGALPQLTELYLQENQIGDAGLAALASACGSGALPRLNVLCLGWNKIIGDAGIAALASACGSGAIPQLQILSLDNNQIGDDGMQAFATACGSGAMANLTNLYLGGNPGNNEPAMKALRERKA